MAPRLLVLAVSALILTVSAALWFNPVSATVPSGQSVTCGSAAEPSLADAQRRSDIADGANGLVTRAGRPEAVKPNPYVGFEAACAAAVSARKPWAWVALIVGGLAAAAAFATRKPARCTRGEAGDTGV
jgi:hypothetical protein